MGTLVTGIGYIGAKLAEMLLSAGERVVGLDNSFSTDRSVLQRLARHPRFLFVLGDVTDEVAVRRAFESGVAIDTVYHLAAQSSASRDAAPTRYTEAANLVGPRVVLEQACSAGARTFIFGSSLQVYGRRLAGRVDETRPFGPILDISHLSKVYVEKLMEMFSHNRGIQCIAARIGLVYGLSPVMKTDPRFMTAPNKFCLQAARHETIRINADGLQPTSLVHVEDVCHALLALSRWPRPGFSAVNVTGETASIMEVAELVQQIARSRGLEVTINADTLEAPGHGCTFLSALSELGFAPRRSLKQELPAVLDYFMVSQQQVSETGVEPPSGLSERPAPGDPRREPSQ